MNSEYGKQALVALRTKYCEVLDPLVPRGSRCALVDFPNHANVGDSAIWLGEINYLIGRNCRIAYVCDCYNYSQSALRELVGDGVILLHGGGNFGDLYPVHQRLRERVIADFPANRIIQLPQSIHFMNASELVRAINVYSRHTDLHILARDTSAFVSICESFKECKAALCPDSALMLDIKPFSRSRKRMHALVLARADKEKALEPDAFDSSSVMDWMAESTLRLGWLYKKAHERLGWKSKIPMNALAACALFASNDMAKERLSRGVDILSSGSFVVTDRLHALILTWLGGGTVFYVDNTYGKLTNFVDTWLASSERIIKCQSYSDASAKLRNRLFA